MNQPKSFKDLGIKSNLHTLTGDKIKIERILNKEIIVKRFRIDPSKYPEKGNGKCLSIELQMNGLDYVVFTGSSVLMDMIRQVPPESFPFTTQIVKVNDHFEFT